MVVKYTRAYSSATTKEVSTANQELVSSDLFPPTFTYYHFKSLDFASFQDCTVIINGTSEIKVKSGVGIGFKDWEITSFVIVEAGIEYYFVAYS